jgi:hypothetical protein
VKTTAYFEAARLRADRVGIKLEWIMHVVGSPEVQQVQADGRIRRWARIPDAQDRWLRVVLLPNGETIHSAFFDRRFTP